MRNRGTWSRRSVLAGLGGVAVAATAGCQGDGGDTEGENSPAGTGTDGENGDGTDAGGATGTGGPQPEGQLVRSETVTGNVEWEFDLTEGDTVTFIFQATERVSAAIRPKGRITILASNERVGPGMTERMAYTVEEDRTYLAEIDVSGRAEVSMYVASE